MAITEVPTAEVRARGADASSAAVALTIVCHPDARRVGDRLLLRLGTDTSVDVSRNAPEFVRPGEPLGAPLGDPFLSRTPLRFTARSSGRLRLTIESSRISVIADARIDGSVEFTAKQLARGVPIEIAGRVVLLAHCFDPEVGEAGDPLGMLGHSAGVRRVRAAIERITDLTVPVLIRGETGTGKELVARAIHDRSPRRDGPFVSVNLGAIPRDLAATELFGATRGAFTGATRDREGLFRTAHGGTLFLDEIGETSPEVQVMLLRVLETGELYPVGADRPVATQVRLIAATDANLQDRIRDGRFKAPLLHRIASYEVRIPPLRERREDIGLLFCYFARHELEAIGEAHRLSPQDPYTHPWLPASIAAQLVRYAWPGNIRQLRNVTRQLVIGSRGHAQLRLDPRLAEELAAAADSDAVPAPVPSDARTAPSPALRKASEVNEHELREALRESAWDLKAAAHRLRIPRPSIYDLIARYPTLRTAGNLGAEEIAQCFRDCGGDLDAMVAQLQVSRRALGRRVRELGLARHA